MKSIIEYMNDLAAFYRKWWKFIMKVMAIYAAICAVVGLIYTYHWKISQFLVKSQEKLGNLIFGKPEIMEDAGGLAPEEEDDNSVVATF